MTFLAPEPTLAALVSQALSHPTEIIVVVVATEAYAQRIESDLRELCGAFFDPADIICLPGFVQVGVFRFESSRKIVARRLAVLASLRMHTPRFVVCSVAGFARRIPSMEWLESNTQVLKPGQELDADEFMAKLSTLAYTQVPRVEEVGEFAVRGSIMDLWTPGCRTPARIELFGDTVDKLRAFRASDQRSFEVLSSLDVLPAREFVWPKDEALEGAIDAFNTVILAQRMGGAARADLLENLRHAVPFAGVDDVSAAFSDSGFAAFHERLAAVSKERGMSLSLVTLGDPKDLCRACEELRLLFESAAQAAYGKGHLVPKPGSVFPHLEALEANFMQGNPAPVGYERVRADVAVRFDPASLSFAHDLLAASRQKFADRANALLMLLSASHIKNLLLLARTHEGFEEFSGLLARYIPAFAQVPTGALAPRFDPSNLTSESPVGSLVISEGISLAQADIEGVFYIPSSGTLAVSESWLRGVSRHSAIENFTSEETTKDTSKSAAETFMAAQFAEFIEGDFVVHVQYGIARFKGLVTIKVLDITGDFLALEYAGNDKVYVPVHKMNLVQRYIGSGRSDDNILDSLKGGNWEKRKQRAKADAEKLAKELMEHQAKRAMTPGHAFTRSDEEYLTFEDAFPFDETPDQLRALREIMVDMGKPKAMDRLLCGDVGFGKTEVAMRAAYRCVLDGKQVAWLVPTTVLAHQHYRNLKERFAAFGVQLALLDRSQGAHGAKSLERLKNGTTDIVIGTHRLLSKDILFRDLGLLIVDEEQRFGVLQKEKIKTMSYGIDVLTMTATPIPRTLQMAMVGLRELSLLTTPPKARLAVKTFVCPFDETIVRDAIQFEIARGGQVFYVHNRVEELRTVEEYLKNLVPGARICIGHGKMGQKELDETIIAFLDNRYDILLCTTIIESGIDMPNVNTIFVQNSDNFGLAQLYQLRGRVGRRSTRGYAYFLTSPDMGEDDEGAKRLEILKEHQELGSGFVIASHDLEMRGAGNILGDEQSGRVSDVGLETYTQMLDDAIKSLGGLKVKVQTDVDLQIPVSAQIPEDYIENARERLRVYRRFFGARSEEALLSLVHECEDRFGPLPDSVKILTEIARLRRLLVIIGATSLVVGEDVTELRLSSDVLQPQDDDGQSEVLVRRILDVCNRHMKGVRITPDGRLLVSLRKRQFFPPNQNGMGELKRLLSLLAGESYAEK